MQELTTLWTPEQIALTIAIAACCLILGLAGDCPHFARGTGASPSQSISDKRRAAKWGLSPWARQHDPQTTSPAPRLALGIVLALVAIFLLSRGGDPVGTRPDSWSDANVLVSGRNYVRHGLFTDYAAAQHQVITETNPPDPFFLYTQYPVASNVINGLWQLAGVGAERVYRLLPAACSVLAVVVWFGVFRHFAGPGVATLACVVMATSYGFLAYADNLHFHAYAFFLCAAAVRCFVRAMSPQELRRPRWLLLTALLMFVLAMFTWEYHLWILLFIAGYALLFKPPIRRAYLVLLVLPLLAGLSLQAAQRRLAFADVQIGAGQDEGRTSFLDDIRRRTIGFEEAADTPQGLTLAGYPAHLLRRFYMFYGLPLAAAAALLACLLFAERRNGRRSDAGRLLIVLGVASLGWWSVMLQHTAVHPHVMRHALVAYSLLIAMGLAQGWKMLASGPSNVFVRAAAAGLLLLLAYPQAEGLLCDLRIHYAGAYCDARLRGDCGVLEPGNYLPLNDSVPPGAVILTNDNRLPVMRLWTDRPVYSGALLQPGANPDDRSDLELAASHVRQLYGGKFPAMYFVHRSLSPDPHEAITADPWLQTLLLGRDVTTAAALDQAVSILSEAVSLGHSPRSFCPIVGVAGMRLCFDMGPAIPLLLPDLERRGYPTLKQFGPPR